MGKYIGVDWAARGWLGIVLEEDGWTADVFPSVLSLWKYHSDADRVLIDVPIGLPADGKRACDVRAKEVLGRRGSSVFYAPIRPAVYEPTLDAAKAINEAAGFSIQNQAWGIVPRIREVDEFLDVYPGARDRFRETHPEVCFHALNGGPLARSKHTDEGIEERTAILRAEAPEAVEIYEEIGDRYATPAYAPAVGAAHDVLDAVVAAVTARRDERDLATLPEDPPADERGLAMEIVYPSPAVQTTLPTPDL